MGKKMKVAATAFALTLAAALGGLYHGKPKQVVITGKTVTTGQVAIAGTTGTLIFSDTFASGSFSAWDGGAPQFNGNCVGNGGQDNLGAAPVSASTAHLTYWMNSTCNPGQSRDQGIWGAKALSPEVTDLNIKATFTQHAPTIGGALASGTGSKLYFIDSEAGGGLDYYNWVLTMTWNGGGQAYFSMVMQNGDPCSVFYQDIIPSPPFTATQDEQFIVVARTHLNTPGASDGWWTAAITNGAGTYYFSNTGLNLRGTCTHGFTLARIGMQLNEVPTGPTQIKFIRDLSAVCISKNGPC